MYACKYEKVKSFLNINLKFLAGFELQTAKHMKKKLLMIGISLLTLSSYAKYPVLDRKAHNGGIFGYRDVEETFGSITTANGTHSGWFVHCDEPGFRHCSKVGTMLKPALTLDFDEVQYQQVVSLEAFAFLQVETGITSGVKTVRVSVEGESTIRVYELSWNFSGGDEHILITRDDVAL